MDSCGFPTKLDEMIHRLEELLFTFSKTMSGSRQDVSQLNGAEGDVSLEDFIADVIFSGYSADTNMHQN